MRRLFIFTLFMLAGCDFKDIPRADWELAAKQYSCSVDQMTKVQNEAEWCDKHTDYLSTYCYGSAIMRNCAKLSTSAAERQQRERNGERIDHDLDALEEARQSAQEDLDANEMGYFDNRD